MNEEAQDRERRLQTKVDALVSSMNRLYKENKKMRDTIEEISSWQRSPGEAEYDAAGMKDHALECLISLYPNE